MRFNLTPEYRSVRVKRHGAGRIVFIDCSVSSGSEMLSHSNDEHSNIHEII